MDQKYLKMGQEGLKIVFWTKKHLFFCFKKLVNLALKPASNASVLPWIVQPGVEYSKAGADLFLCLQ